MDSRFLLYIKHLMIIGGTLPVDLINSRKRIYIFYRYVTHTFVSLVGIYWLGGNMNVDGFDRTLFNYIYDRIFVMISYVNLAITTSGNFQKLIYEMIAYEAEVLDVGSEKHLKIHEQVVKKSRTLQVYYISILASCSIAFVVPAFVEYALVQSSEESTNSTINTHNYELWIPFEESKEYLVWLLVQSCYTLIVTCIYCSYQIILINLLLVVILRLKILRARIENMKDIERLDAKRLIRIYAKEHIDLIRNCKHVDDTVKYVMLMEFLFASLRLALSIFLLVTANTPNSKIYFGTVIVNVLINILILCWNADQIREESIGIADSIYQLPWFEYDKSDVMSLHIMMIRSQTPLTLTTGPFGTVTLDLAGKIVKATYTYATFMHQMYEN
uniref:Odorant receptor n=1 Tax=Anoplophora chinensis TaxID=217632 RepID=A0A2H4ZB92_ANOCN|nr:odorant receptor [Anoplophora chinensis]